MLTLIVALIIVVIIICECISDCVKHKHRNTCCCDDCPYREECLEVFEDDR
jgi:hypothetical protein